MWPRHKTEGPLPPRRHITRKVFHASLHTLGLVSLVLAIAAVVLSKVWNTPARGHMYTVHSYSGAATVALSVFQVRAPL